MKVSPGKTNLWNTKYWCVWFTFDEDEYDDNPAWAMHLKGRGLVAGVLTGAQILSDKATIGSSPRLDGRTVTIRATVNPLKKDGSFAVRTEIIDFDHTNTKRFARLPERVQDAYRIFCQSLDDVLRREAEIDEEERRLRQGLMSHWESLFTDVREAEEELG